MDQWIEIGSRFGLPVLIVAALGFFLVRHVWPFVTNQIQDAKEARKTEVAEFVATIRSRDVMMAESQRLHLQALTDMTGEVRGVKSEVISVKEILNRK